MCEKLLFVTVVLTISPPTTKNRDTCFESEGSFLYVLKFTKFFLNFMLK